MFKEEFSLDRGFVSLGEVHTSVGYSIKDLKEKYGDDWKIVGPHIIARKNSKEAHEKTLAYIREMLEKGELKVGRLNETKEEDLEEARKNPSDIIFLDVKGTTDELIEYIRTKWDEAQKESVEKNNGAILSGFESWIIVFTLKENEWPRAVN